MADALIGRGCFFGHPDAADPSRQGLCLSNRGGIELIRGHALIEQSIVLLLSTRRGERVMRPGYGCELDELVFLPNDVTTAGLAIHYTRRALERWEPRIEILRLDAGPHREQPSKLVITLDYRILADGSEKTLRFDVDLSGESS